MKQQDFNSRSLNYHCGFTVSQSPKEVFDAINRVQDWWTENFKGSTGNPENTWTVHFGETFVTAKVVELVPYEKIVWKVIDCYLHWLNDKKEWNNTDLVWEISAGDQATQVDFTHVGLVPEIECYDSCVKGWDQYAKQSLFKLIMEGKGLPDKKKIPAKA